MGVIDRGLMPETTLATRHPVPEPSRVETASDERRIRAALVTVLRRAGEQGDALLSTREALERLGELDLLQPVEASSDWLAGHARALAGAIEPLEAMVRVGEESGGEKRIPALQLAELSRWEKQLAKVLRARAEKALPGLGEDWRQLIQGAIEEAGGRVDPRNPRHQTALDEQVKALERITTRKLSVLVGRAGSGKTSVLGALLRCRRLSQEGILLLAPTGKARVRLGRATEGEAMTVAQFLHGLGRYDGERQRPRLTGKEKYRKERTVIVDECSMLTLDTLLALLEALDLSHVQRLILVGDPNQLPPIGVGRPFADLVGSLDGAALSDATADQQFAGALARLTVEVRTAVGEGQADSDTLRLASWFTRERQPIDPDRVLSDLELGKRFNDLEICFWKTPEELRKLLLAQFGKHLGLATPGDVEGFNRSLGINEKGWVPFEAPDGAENWQLLSPVRMHPHGVNELNRWLQQQFRSEELKWAREHRAISLGDEEIVVRDKVIQLRNGGRTAYDGNVKERHYLANGEIGMVAPSKGDWLNVLFAGRPNLRFGYGKRDFPSGSGPLQLAYALTVHKAQGSEFKQVFVVIPRQSRLLSRELLYTALTRSRQKLVLLIEGSDGSLLYDLTRPERSEMARRNTNLFFGAIREESSGVPYADHLIHRTEKGHLVRSKSELVIANMLFGMGLDYEYERPLDGTTAEGRLRPDFSFVTAAGDLIVWEHLGMLDREEYRKAWEWKRQWYEKNGFELGKTLFTTEERGRLDSTALRAVAQQIKALL